MNAFAPTTLLRWKGVYLPHHLHNVNDVHSDRMSTQDRIGLMCANGISSMNFFWVCNALCALPLLCPSTLAVVQFISSGWWQLIFLPILAVQNRLQAQKDSIRADIDHAHRKQQDERLERMETMLKELLGGGVPA